jgi:phage terminase large subunit-like protein
MSAAGKHREIEVDLPTLHSGQVSCFDNRSRYYAVRCGRRWGKSTFGSIIAEDALIKSELVGYFAPDYKRLTEIINEISEVIEPVRKYPSGGRDIIRTITGGRLDFWTLEDLSAGRSRKYHKVIIDEAAFTKPNMMDIWSKAIKPTLLDYRGSALVLSNTNGADPDQFFWKICNEPEHGFKEYHAPSQQNPLLPREDLEAWAKTMHPLVYAQEILADFVDWSGVAFFAKDKMLVNGQPVAMPAQCDSVFAVIDTAVKTGKDNDGTAVGYFSRSKFGKGYPLVLLDWDIQQIEGALLETWLPNVFRRLEELAQLTHARSGSIGAYIEDKSSGSILLQQAKRRGQNVHEIESDLTAMGKDERAINASGYFFQEKVKLSAHAYDKTVSYKGATRNHFLSQVCGFRIGDKTPGREDDLLDVFCYGIALALGNTDGY